MKRLSQPQEYPEFGARVPGVAYVTRPGAYAVIFDPYGNVAVISTPQGYFLPGGGLEAGEGPEDALLREVQEECGFQVVVTKQLGAAVEYVLSRDGGIHYRIQGDFFQARLVSRLAVAVEADHRLVWLSRVQACEVLQRESQRWAVQQAIESQGDTLPILQLESVCVQRQGMVLLQDVDWAIYPGQQWAVTGPNGGGKSLLMQVILGRAACSAGSVVYARQRFPAGMALVSLEQHQQVIAREQEQAFFRQFSKSGEEGTSLRQFLEERPGDAGSLLKWLGLDGLLDSPLLALSNGEMRKTLLVRALQQSPGLLILDEPFDGLDAASRQALAEGIERLMDSGQQIVLVAHRREDILPGFTHLLGLQGGRVFRAGERTPELESGLFARLVGNPPARQESDLRGPADPAHPAVATVVMKDVSVAYGSKLVLDRFNWTARRDENWAIVGPNGAGKTTLLRLISADHLQAYANEIYLFGRQRGSGESIWEIKERIGVLSPELQIAYRQDLTTLDVVISGLHDSIGIYRRTTAEQEARAGEWMGLLQLDSLAQRGFDTLSYGQRRMVLLARALVKSPEMLLLDEPCQGLDGENCHRLVEMVDLVHSRTGTQIFYITHRRDELPRCITHLLEFERKTEGAGYEVKTGPVGNSG